MSTPISLSSAQAIKPYIAFAVTDATSGDMTPGTSAPLVILFAVVERLPSILSPRRMRPSGARAVARSLEQQRQHYAGDKPADVPYASPARLTGDGTDAAEQLQNEPKPDHDQRDWDDCLSLCNTDLVEEQQDVSAEYASDRSGRPGSGCLNPG
jgi:hypothetical protein